MPILSIIIPVYNARQYLKRCVESVLNQDVEDIEVIIVDDGSTDGSEEIYNSLVDSRIVIKKKNNEGVSVARNCGIKLAKGKYIAFVDADDWVSSDIYKEMLKAANTFDSDVVICGINECFDDDSQIIRFSLCNNYLYDKESIIHTIIASDFTNERILNSPCNKLYRREIINQNQISFRNRDRGEDWLFNIEYFQVINSAVYIDKPLYNYCRNSGSAMFKYNPNQLRLWKENRQIRETLRRKYNLQVDLCNYNAVWIENIISFLLSGINAGAIDYIEFSRIVLDDCVQKAIANSARLYYKSHQLFAALVLKKKIRIAYSLAKVRSRSLMTEGK